VVAVCEFVQRSPAGSSPLALADAVRTKREGEGDAVADAHGHNNLGVPSTYGFLLLVFPFTLSRWAISGEEGAAIKTMLFLVLLR